jgi:hypothetical protein
MGFTLENIFLDENKFIEVGENQKEVYVKSYFCISTMQRHNTENSNINSQKSNCAASVLISTSMFL